ncbi:glycosyltransferase family 1 protein, partial [Methylobacterium sp. WL18]
AARAHAARHDWDGPAATFVDLMRRNFPARTPARDLHAPVPHLRG